MGSAPGTSCGIISAPGSCRGVVSAPASRQWDCFGLFPHLVAAERLFLQLWDWFCTWQQL